mgnify:CR=1 FL=1
MRTWSHFSKEAVTRPHHFCKKSKSNKWVAGLHVKAKTCFYQPWTPLVIKIWVARGINSADHLPSRTNILLTNDDIHVTLRCPCLRICHWHSRNTHWQSTAPLDLNKLLSGLKQCSTSRVWLLQIMIRSSTTRKIRCSDNKRIIALMLTYASLAQSSANLKKA